MSDAKYTCPRCGSHRTQYNNIIRKSFCLDCDAIWQDPEDCVTHIICDCKSCDYNMDGVCSNHEIRIKTDVYGKQICYAMVSTGIND